MKQINKQKRLEQYIYWSIWLIVLLVPVAGNYYYDKSANTNIIPNWRILYNTWLRILPFFLLFIANNYLFAPKLLLRKKYLAYSLSILTTIAFLFLFYPCIKNLPQVHFDPPGHEQLQGNGPLPYQNKYGDKFPGHSPEDIPEKQTRGSIPAQPESPDNVPTSPQDKDLDNRSIPHERIFPPSVQEQQPNLLSESKRPQRGFPSQFNTPKRFPGDIPMMTFFQLVTAFLLIGFNIAIKLMFKSIRDEATLNELEHQRLQSELEYLKYQINPHFFMNTLNNIHALVDIDTDQAKTTLIELSKLMRYVLYEASNKTIRLSKEIQFLENYIALMRLRYTDKVNIQVEMPTEPPPLEIPPLLFISFIENAFKHGISYQQKSFVRISLKIQDQRLCFHCLNTSWGKSDDQHHGIGLENICKRLKLLFNDDYYLKIQEKENCFNVSLSIPLL